MNHSRKTKENLFLIVLYKMEPKESQSIQSIIHCARDSQAIFNFRLIIWDNSPKSNTDSILQIKKQAPSIQINYIHTPENTSLSKIYNKVSSDISEDSYLTILDQDTSLPIEYFDEIRIAQENSEPLILPKVICQGLLVSPGKRYFIKGALLKSISSGTVKSKNLLAINSGMCIRGEVFRKIKYNEELHFYGTDTYFMKQYESYYATAFILNTPIIHSLAEMEERSDEWLRAHKAEKHRTLKIIFSDSFLDNLLISSYIAMNKIYSKLKFKNKNK